MKDLFSTPELIPNDVQVIFDSFNDDIDSYIELERLLNEVKLLGYIFDYGLDAEPYGLRPIGVELSELEGFENV